MEKYGEIQRYDKLVRDKIPEIIKGKGRELKMHAANEEEWREKLDQKLLEEVQEFLKEKTKEEIADILEVLHAHCEKLGFTWEEVEEERKRKHEQRGGFSQGIILEEA